MQEFLKRVSYVQGQYDENESYENLNEQLKVAVRRQASHQVALSGGTSHWQRSDAVLWLAGVNVQERQPHIFPVHPTWRLCGRC